MTFIRRSLLPAVILLAAACSTPDSTEEQIEETPAAEVQAPEPVIFPDTMPVDSAVADETGAMPVVPPATSGH
jgi:hypothetical protein